MDMIAFIPFAVLGAFITLNFTILYLLQKKDHKDMQEYLRRWQIESDKNDKNVQRILDDIQKTNQEMQKTNHDNSLFLRMIFERVDRPHPQ
jgi:Na+/melibiose symporter-like transporter